MTRKLARVVKVGSIAPIPDANAIETAHVGGWKVVVKKNEFTAGQLAVYFEIDSFLPAGNPAWQFLVEKSAKEFHGQVGHVLTTVRLRGQISQGLLLPLPPAYATAQIGTDLTEALGVLKYEKPIPAELLGVIRGYMPRVVPKTDQERIQNLVAELEHWRAGTLWEVTEKLEGESCTYAWLEGELHVCTRQLDLLEASDHAMWHVARRYDLEARMRELFGSRNVAIQGEHVGAGVEGNIYGMDGQDFWAYAAYDIDTGNYLLPQARRALIEDLGLKHAPVLDESFELGAAHDMDTLLAQADGPSVLKPTQRREGKVYKSLTSQDSFKTISNAYLLKSKL